MRKIFYILVLVSAFRQLSSQSNKIDLYEDFQKTKPKYTKCTTQEILFDNEGPYDTVLVRKEEWTNNEDKTTMFNWFRTDANGCSESTTIKVVNPSKRNTSLLKFYSCDSLKGIRHTTRYSDSTIVYYNKPDNIVFKSNFNKNDNSWTSYYKVNNTTIKGISTEDSIKKIDIDFQNDTLTEKTISFKRQKDIDSTIYLDVNNKLISKNICQFNKIGDIIYQEKTEYNTNTITVIKSTYIYVYDKYNNWTEKVVNAERHPQTNEISKHAFIRTIIYN